MCAEIVDVMLAAFILPSGNQKRIQADHSANKPPKKQKGDNEANNDRREQSCHNLSVKPDNHIPGNSARTLKLLLSFPAARIKQSAKQRDHDQRREKDHVIKRWKVFQLRNHGEEHDNQ